jgi:hypothetical protein
VVVAGIKRDCTKIADGGVLWQEFQALCVVHVDYRNVTRRLDTEVDSGVDSQNISALSRF